MIGFIHRGTQLRKKEPGIQAPAWLETGPRQQQNCTDCHKENARPVRTETQESHAARWRLQSVANRSGGIRTAQRSPPNSGAYHVQDPAENEQRAKPYQEHSRLSIHRCPAQQNWNQSREGRIRSGRNKFQKLELVSGPRRSVACTASVLKAPDIPPGRGSPRGFWSSGGRIGKSVMASPAGIDIVRRAYKLWEQAGKPEGRDQEFYLQAERELQEALDNKSSRSRNAE